MVVKKAVTRPPEFSSYKNLKGMHVGNIALTVVGIFAVFS